MRTEAGQTSFAVLLFQDLAVIPILALLPLLAVHPAAHAGGARGGSMDGRLAGLAARALRPSARWRWSSPPAASLVRPIVPLIARTRLREVFTAAALLLVIGIALLMAQVGLSPRSARSSPGVLLADSEYRHELEADIEPFKGLLLGLFFIAVGTAIDFALICESAAAVIGALVGALAA